MPIRSLDTVDFKTRFAARATTPPAMGPAPADSVDSESPAAPPGGSPPYQGADLVAADSLAELGWDADSIRKLFAGPDQASIHELANPKLAGTPFQGTAGTATAGTTSDPPQRPADATTADQPPAIVQPSALYGPSAYGQGVIVQAIWSSLHGEPSTLLDLADNVKALPPVLQAYVKAACEAGQRDYVDLEKWKIDFARRETSADAERTQKAKERDAVVSSAIAAAAAAVNVIPVVGQVLSAALVVSLAIRQAVLAAFPLPVRNADDQVRDGYEGRSCYAGIAWTPGRNDYLHTKQWVVQDPVASQLPTVPVRTAFPFAPTIRDFQNAVRALKLYDSIGRPDLNDGGNPDYSSGGS